jgi:hypothetical protein
MIRDQFTPKPDLEPGKYQHYRGDMYEVVDVACNSETLEWYVVYRPLYEALEKPRLWVRPYEIFTQNIEQNGTSVPRFKKVDE